MEDIKKALLLEANNWIGPDDTFSDWCSHVLIDPSPELHAAFQAVDIEDDEEFEDAMGLLYEEVYAEVTGI